MLKSDLILVTLTLVLFNPPRPFVGSVNDNVARFADAFLLASGVIEHLVVWFTAYMLVHVFDLECCGLSYLDSVADLGEEGRSMLIGPQVTVLNVVGVVSYDS